MIKTVRNINVNYEIFGQGKPIIFVHGWGGSIASLKNLALLSAKKYRSIILDLPGFGKSDNPEKTWGVEEYGEFISEFIKDLNCSPVVYFGHSYGGSLGIYLAVNHPEQIDKLILCASAFRRKNQVARTTKKIKRIGRLLPFIEKLEPNLKRVYYRLFFPNSDLTKYPHLEQNFRKIITQDLSHLPEKIETDTLILWGDQDTYTPVDMAYELKNKIAKAKMTVYPYMGHNLPLKHPELIYPDITKFI
jgi:pimeloyl-ACP methyl ester carboxylesterase